MEYVTEDVDRRTGELVVRSQGDWITVTELGSSYGVGPKRVRAILYHMGLLRPEGPHGRYRLTPTAVHRGFGKRHDRPKRGRYPFDVISPLGQTLIKQAWTDVVADLDGEVSGDPEVCEAQNALTIFQSSRLSLMTTKEAVRWLNDFRRMLTQRQIASALEVSEQLVGRYLNQLRKERGKLQWHACWRATLSHFKAVQ